MIQTTASAPMIPRKTYSRIFILLFPDCCYAVLPYSPRVIRVEWRGAQPLLHSATDCHGSSHNRPGDTLHLGWANKCVPEGASQPSIGGRAARTKQSFARRRSSKPRVNIGQSGRTFNMFCARTATVCDTNCNGSGKCSNSK